MTHAIVAVAMVGTVASAQTARSVELDASSALDAAMHDRCEDALQLAARVKTADAAYWRAHIASHAAITACDPSLRASAAPPLPRPPTPPLSGGRILGETLVGGGVGIGGIVVGGIAGAIVYPDDPGEGGILGAGALVGAYTGMVVGVAVGVHLIASYGDQTSSLGWTMAGSLIPGAVGGGIMLGAAYSQNDPLLAVGVGVGFAGPVIGSLVASNVTRRWESKRPSLLVAPTVTRTQHGTVFGLAGQF